MASDDVLDSRPQELEMCLYSNSRACHGDWVHVAPTIADSFDSAYDVLSGQPHSSQPSLQTSYVSAHSIYQPSECSNQYSTASPPEINTCTSVGGATSPVTPIQSDHDYWPLVPDFFPCTHLDAGLVSIQEMSEYAAEDATQTWMTDSLPLQAPWADFERSGPGASTFTLAGSRILSALSDENSCLSLSSQLVFDNGHGLGEQPNHKTFLNSETSVPLYPSRNSTRIPQYSPIAPCSPRLKIETKIAPVTPAKVFGLGSATINTSPTPAVSPITVLSSQSMDLEWSPTTNLDSEELDLMYARASVSVRNPNRRRGHLRGARKRTSSVVGSEGAKKGSAANHRSIIPASKHVCSQPGCNRRFVRQEHRKRHERTIHPEPDAPIFRCWACNQGFSRNDNLKSHFGTHSGKSSARRNRYVATLDDSSEYYDPDYAGDLTYDGYPVREEIQILRCPVKGCAGLFHKKEALKAHEVKKEHGPEPVWKGNHRFSPKVKPTYSDGT